MTETQNIYKNIYKKIALVQEGIGKLVKDKPGFNYKYYDINQLLEQLNPLLEKQDIVLTQPLTNVDGRPALKTMLVSGVDTIEETITLPDLSDPQKMGSAITYYRRYALVSLFALEAEDDDANSAKPSKDIQLEVSEDDLSL